MLCGLGFSCCVAFHFLTDRMVMKFSNHPLGNFLWALFVFLFFW